MRVDVLDRDKKSEDSGDLSSHVLYPSSCNAKFGSELQTRKATKLLGFIFLPLDVARGDRWQHVPCNVENRDYL